MAKTLISIMFAVLGVILTLGCVGEKDYQNKKLYAVVAFALFVLLLVSVIV